MKMLNRFISMLLAVSFLPALMPAWVFAAEPAAEIAVPDPITAINPEYADGWVPDFPELEEVPRPYGLEYTSDLEEAADILRQGLTARQEEIHVPYLIPEDGDYQAMIDELWAAALKHTGVPTEGDYIGKQWGGYRVSFEVVELEGKWYFVPLWQPRYYTTAEQEAQMDTAVDGLLESLDLTGKTDYEKYIAIYQWMCGNITYDYENLEDDSYMLKYTGYAAMVNRTSVCQGYAILLYRLLLEVGVDCRIVTGLGNGGRHAWNIVGVEGLYYNADATWDSNYGADVDSYYYSLRCSVNFVRHTRDEQFETEAFHAAYPMGKADYVPKVPVMVASGQCGDELYWKLDEEGNLTVYGTGAMWDFALYGTNAPWVAHKDSIRNLVIEGGTTTIGQYAFYGYPGMAGISLPDTLTEIGVCALYGCSGLTEITIPDSVTTISRTAFYGCSGLTEVVIPDSVTNLGGSVFGGCAGLTEVTIGSGVTRIDDSTFSGCTNLRDVVIPAGVTSIELFAFQDCLNLTGLVFVGDAPEFKRNVFIGSVVTATYPAGNATWTEEVRQNYGGNVTWIALCPGHVYDAVVTAPTCTEAGYTTHTCSVCGHSYTDAPVDALGHHLTQYEAQTPTCTEIGWEAYESCARCDHSTYREIAATGHSHTAVVTAPTCTAGGFTTHTCHCGDSYVDGHVDALGHHLTQYEAQAPTCTEIGWEAYESCSRCDHSTYREIAATGHHFENGECTVCGNLDYVFGDLNGDGKINMLDVGLVVSCYNGVKELEDVAMLAADVNGDGKINMLDVGLIISYYNGVIDKFPA